jgi:arylsulfatase
MITMLKSLTGLVALAGTATIAMTSSAPAALPAEVEATTAEPTLSTAPPNIVVIWGDDIGWYNISAYNLGVMGYQTPNIDRIAKEGALFTDWYGQQSCTAGRSAFVTGQSPLRTGLLKVGLPGAKEGISEKDPSIAGLLNNHGYVSAQYGKNHLGDLDEHLPTNHGFDEFFGNLYHLNAEEEPENEDFPDDPEFKKKYGPRGVIKSTSDGKIEDTGPLTKKRMETVDYEVTAGALDFMERAHASGKPFFLWWNSTRMHVFTHLREDVVGKSGLGIYPDGMLEHDMHVGQLLDKIDELGITDNTVVMYSSDNGAETFTWPDGGTTPFRGEKNSNWEGGYRVPCAMRWPGTIKPGTIVNDIGSHEDMLPTLLAAAGEGDIKEKLVEGGVEAIGRSYKVHLDGYNLMPALSGETDEWPRKEFLYWTDGGDLACLRYNQWKLVFLEQRAEGMDVWQDPLVELRLPKLFNIRSDPFERADHEAIGYGQWRFERLFLLVPAQVFVAEWLSSLKEFPPRQEPGSFSLSKVMAKLRAGASGGAK